jgi:hypothetical protein
MTPPRPSVSEVKSDVFVARSLPRKTIGLQWDLSESSDADERDGDCSSSAAAAVDNKEGVQQGGLSSVDARKHSELAGRLRTAHCPPTTAIMRASETASSWTPKDVCVVILTPLEWWVHDCQEL